MKKIEENLYCPFQGHPTTQQLRHIHHMKSAGDWSEASGKPIFRDIDYYVGRCKKEDHLILYSTETVGDMKSDTADKFELLWPNPDILPDSVPTEVRRCYIEANKAKNYNSDTFGFHIRKGLEAVCDDCGISRYKEDNNTWERSLDERIRDLVEKKNLPPIIEEMMRALRISGNKAVHHHLNHRLVPDVDLFFRALVQYVYVWPDRLKEILKNIQGLKASYDNSELA